MAQAANEVSIISGNELKAIYKKRANPYIFENIKPEFVEEYTSNNWTIDKKMKNRIKVKKIKPIDELFEDNVWCLFVKMGFICLNRDRTFKISYSNDGKLSQQIDVFAKDAETIIIVECKATSEVQKKSNFKETIEAIGGKKEGIVRTLRKCFPDNKYKIKFIFATKNYIIGEQDQERLNNYEIAHFDDETIRYYSELAKHLGSSSRFQLLGYLFADQSIPQLDTTVPAIQGKLGGHTYYSFSIEPEKLLKTSYILHRNNANKKMMPTYQRLIKKARLHSIQSFINAGGFFPNSIVINIVSNGKKIRFDIATPQVESSISKIGLLYLPKNYRSAYIIDGQHRLYAYGDSDYTKKHSIPVVAFIDLEREEQIKLFMQINENQKAVPKNLQNTLNSDILWDSPNLIERIKALKLQIAQSLGEDYDSPLYDRVIIGESEKSKTRCISIETIKTGLDRSNFFGEFTRDSIKADGTFYKGNNDATMEYILPFLKETFFYLRESLQDEWEKGESYDGFVFINAGIESFIRLFSDIVDHLIESNKIVSKKDKTTKIVEELKYYIDPVIAKFKSLSSDEKYEYKKSYGVAGKTSYWRNIQEIVAEARNDFNPEGLSKYLEDSEKKYNEESFRMIRDIETKLKDDFKIELQKVYGANWFKLGVPQQVYLDANSLKSQKELDEENLNKEIDPWDCLNIIDYRKIAVYGSNWQNIFEKKYTRPEDIKIRGGKEEKTKWLQRLERIRNQNFHSYAITKDEYDFLGNLYKWLF